MLLEKRLRMTQKEERSRRADDLYSKVMQRMEGKHSRISSQIEVGNELLICRKYRVLVKFIKEIDSLKSKREQTFKDNAKREIANESSERERV